MTARDDKRGEVLLCCASGEGTHQFKVVADEAGVMAFLEEMCGGEQDGTMTHSLAHYRDEDNWTNGGTAYNVKLYCAEFSVWKVLPGELAFTPSHARQIELDSATVAGTDPHVAPLLASALSTTPQKPGATPRTEAMIESCGDYEKAYHYNGRFAEFARQLEREVNELHQRIDNDRVERTRSAMGEPELHHIDGFKPSAPDAYTEEMRSAYRNGFTTCRILVLHYLAGKIRRPDGSAQS